MPITHRPRTRQDNVDFGLLESLLNEMLIELRISNFYMSITHDITVTEDDLDEDL